MDDDWFTVLASLFSIVLLIVVIGLPGRQIAHHLDVNNCRTFHSQTGYETKFVDYHFLKWDCMAKTQTGKWVSSDNIREID